MEVDRALSAAGAAFEEWREYSHIDRVECLWEMYGELRDRTDELDEIVTRECSKEIRLAQGLSADIETEE